MSSETLGPVGKGLYDKLKAAFAPSHLQVMDESHKHAGHAGARPEGETHFSVIVTSDAFEGKSRVARQRLVYDCLRQELATRVHALSLKTMAPSEKP